jgi:hypothetical protein
MVPAQVQKLLVTVEGLVIKFEQLINIAELPINMHFLKESFEFVAIIFKAFENASGLFEIFEFKRHIAMCFNNQEHNFKFVVFILVLIEKGIKNSKDSYLFDIPSQARDCFEGAYC